MADTVIALPVAAPGPSASTRSRLSIKLLSRLPRHEIEMALTELEASIEKSELDVRPPGAWVGDHTDTVLAYLDSKLVAALVVRTVAMLDPLVMVADAGPMPHVVLDQLRTRAEGVLMAHGQDSYYFGLAEDAGDMWAKLVAKIGRVERLADRGIEMYRRKL